mmetsp:Transcript_17454/g.26990  ORF Transcript_17454/g.26990 Transcript_17454/m.26990 type:complete len:358 (-) Transcript_17454:63-1136(-)
MGRQQIIVNALLVLLGFAVSGGFKHFFNSNDSNIGQANISSENVATDAPNVEEQAATPPPVASPEVEEYAEYEEPKKIIEDKRIKFVYYMGLEGAGHDYLHRIGLASPTMQHLKDSDAFPQDAHKLQGSLLDREAGLWSAYFSSSTGEMLNLTGTRSMLVNTLRRMENKIGRHGGAAEHYYVPVNILSVPYGEYGPVRYLNDPIKGKVRMISYPTIELFYDACEEAGVDCRHVYLYRDPYELLHTSTAKHVLEGMHTATSMLLIIASQMRMYPERTLGCWNLWTKQAEDVPGMQQVFGWEATTDYEQVVTEKYVPLNVTTGKEVRAIVPAMNQNYFDSMLKTHEMVLGVCRRDAVLR